VTVPSPFNDDLVALTGQGLVDGVVDHLVDHVVQAGPVIGVADIHARALAHRLEAAQNLDGIRVVVTPRLFGRLHEILVVGHRSGSLPALGGIRSTLSA
jgi:hypothetical protein